MAATSGWQRIDNRPVPATPGEIRAFMVVRNEVLRLPSTMRHHRELGVDRFFIIDHDSDDGTLDFIAAQPDVHVFRTTESWSSGRWGVDWINAILDVFGDGHWTLTIDADEHFIYPHYEELELRLFCRYLDYVNAQAAFCFVLDMYSDRPVAETVHDPRTSLLDTCHYFDPGEYRAISVPDCPYRQIYGGVRERMFQNVGVDFHPPTLSTVPLVRWRRGGVQFLHGRHVISPVTTAGVTSALLHFKFLSDFHDRVELEAVRGERFAGAREYRAYRDLLRLNEAVSFFGAKSMSFEDSNQLVRLGLMKSEEAFEQSVRMTRDARA